MRNTQNMKKYHYIEKYNEEDADALKTMEHKIHYKLYMIYTKYGYDKDGSHIDGNHTSLERLAGAMGVSRQQFSKYISPNKPNTPDIYALYKLSLYTNIPFEYLVDDTIECSESYSNGNSEQLQIANEKLCKSTISKHLTSEAKNREMLWGTFLKETGLDDVLLQRLTETARMDLTKQVKDLVDRTLSQKANLYQPINPVDDEYIDYIEGEELCQIM